MSISVLQELWSGFPPYHGVKPERISILIDNYKLPSFPSPTVARFERLREQVRFVCNLCWSESPGERKSMAELIRILRYSIRECVYLRY